MSSPRTQTPKSDDLKAVANAIREHDRFLLATHENPDGDALGSLLATKLVLDELGKDSVMYLSGEAPLPAEYKFMALEDLRRTLPADVEQRVLFALDCANESRLGQGQEALERAPLVLNVDHHHDNTHFGNVNVVAAEASSTGEIVRELIAPGRPARRVSLRSSSDELDVSAIARASGDGGGHRQAAGFSSELEIPKIVEFLRKQYTEARAAARA